MPSKTQNQNNKPKTYSKESDRKNKLTIIHQPHHEQYPQKFHALAEHAKMPSISLPYEKKYFWSKIVLKKIMIKNI